MEGQSRGQGSWREGMGGNQFNGLWKAEKWDDQRNENVVLSDGMDMGGGWFCLGSARG